MKIVDRKTFMMMPRGTLFAKYKPCCCEDWGIKGDGPHSDGDFVYTSIDPLAIEHDGSDDLSDKLAIAETGKRTLPMDFDYYGRDGCFDEDQLFAVYDTQDTLDLIIVLLGSISEREVTP